MARSPCGSRHGPAVAGGAEIRICHGRLGRVGPLRVAQLLRPARGPRFPKGPAAGSAEMCMRRRVASSARARPVVPVGPTAGGAASYSAVQLRRGPRAAYGPSWARGRRCPAEHARCQSNEVADRAVNQVGLSGTVTAHGSSELVKAHTPRRLGGRPSCRNTGFKLHGAAVSHGGPAGCPSPAVRRLRRRAASSNRSPSAGRSAAGP